MRITRAVAVILAVALPTPAGAQAIQDHGLAASCLQYAQRYVGPTMHVDVAVSDSGYGICLIADSRIGMTIVVRRQANSYQNILAGGGVFRRDELVQYAHVPATIASALLAKLRAAESALPR